MKFQIGHIPWNKDYFLSDEHKVKISNANKGKKPWNVGIKHSEETKRKISENTKGKRLKEMNPFYGKHHTEKTKQKIRENNFKNNIKPPSRKGMKMSPEIRKKISEALKGEKAPNWQGGISFEPYSIDWTETLRRAIRERDNYICQLCSQYGNCIHHIDYNKKNCCPKNLITLCVGCNTKVNKNRDYWTYFLNNKINYYL